MKAHSKKEKDGSITISINFKPEGSMFEQEKQIAEATNLVGRLAMKDSLEGFDTGGEPLVFNNKRYTSKGLEKKSINAASAKSKM